MRDGYTRRMELAKEQNIEGWRQARLVAYISLKPHLKEQGLSMYEFMPLPGDPKVDVKASEAEALAMIREYERMGRLKPIA